MWKEEYAECAKWNSTWIKIWQLHWTVNYFLQEEELSTAINPEKNNKQKRTDPNPDSFVEKNNQQSKKPNKTNRKLKTP